MQIGRARALALITAFALVSGLGLTVVDAAGKVGVAAAVKNDVQGAGQALSPGSQLFEQEIVKTGVESVAQLIFLDQTSMTLGPKAQVKLDKFVYDPNKKVGDVVLSATKGAFRFVSGTQDPHSYSIQTSVATIGTRGTVVDGYNFENGLLAIVEEGSAIIDGVLVKAGQAFAVLKDGTHEGPFTPDGSFFAVEGNIPLPLYGHDLGAYIGQIQGGDTVGDIVHQIQSEPPPCTGECCVYSC